MQKLALAALLAFASAGLVASAQTVVNPVPVRTCATIARPALDLIVENERGQELFRGAWFERQDGWLKITSNSNLYTITINRRWYKPLTISNIKMKRSYITSHAVIWSRSLVNFSCACLSAFI